MDTSKVTLNTDFLESCAWPGCTKLGHIRSPNTPPEILRADADPAFCEEHYTTVEGKPFDGVILDTPPYERSTAFVERLDAEYKKPNPDPVLPALKACLIALSGLRGAIPNFHTAPELEPYMLKNPGEIPGMSPAAWARYMFVGARALRGGNPPVFVRPVDKSMKLTRITHDLTFREIYMTENVIFVPLAAGSISIQKAIGAGYEEKITSDALTLAIDCYPEGKTLVVSVTCFIVPTWTIRSQMDRVIDSVFSVDTRLHPTNLDQSVFTNIKIHVASLIEEGKLDNKELKGQVGGYPSTEAQLIHRILNFAVSMVNIVHAADHFVVEKFSVTEHFNELYLQPKIVQIARGKAKPELFTMVYLGGLDG